jgi:DNA topoisomerase IB
VGIVIDSRGRRWNPLHHPRGRDGRFIETGGLVRGFLGGSGSTSPDFAGEVRAIDPDGTAVVRLTGGRGRYEGLEGREVRVPADRLESAEYKARLDSPFVRRLSPLSPSSRREAESATGSPLPDEPRAQLDALEDAAEAADDAGDTGTRDMLLGKKSEMRGGPGPESEAVESYDPGPASEAALEENDRDLGDVHYGEMEEVPVEEARRRLKERAEKFGEKYNIPPTWGDTVLVAKDHLHPRLGLIAKNPRTSQGYYTPMHKATQAAAKYRRMAGFLPKIPALEKRLTEGARKGDLASIATLMVLRTGMRISSTQLKNPRSKADGTVFGATTLQARHFSFDTAPDGSPRVRIKFLGKAKQENVYSSDDPELVAALKALKDKAESPYEPMFPRVNSTHTVGLIKESLGPDAINHDLRTLRANAVAMDAVDRINKKFKRRPKDVKTFRERRAEVARAVGKALNDKPDTVLLNYINPLVFEEWRTEPAVAAHTDKFIEAASPAPAAPVVAAAARGASGEVPADPEAEAAAAVSAESSFTTAGMSRMLSKLRLFFASNPDVLGEEAAPPTGDEDDD